MKRSRPFPEASGSSAPTLSVCLFQPGTLFPCPSIASYRGSQVHQHSHHLFRLASPSVPYSLIVHRPTNQHEKHDSNPIAS
jgi:hypothetical protein